MIPADKSFGFDDTGIKRIVLDSRQDITDGLFVPIIGERSDGHDFIDMAISHGAIAVLSSRPVAEYLSKYPDVRFYQVENTVTALQQIGYMERLKFHGTVIGVTGSVGKTTTRSMIASALASQLKVFETAGNANSQVGVPITMFNMARSGADAAVIELGMSNPGEMTRIANTACVDIAVITNIGIAHIEQLKTQENILKEKLHILDGMPENGDLYVNGEDPLLKQLTLEKIHDMDVILGKSVSLHFYASADFPLKLRVHGNHMLQNASAAMHVADKLGLDLHKAAGALEQFTGLKGRGETFVTKAGVTVIDDAYNASPVSMKAGLDVLADLKGSRKIAVLADMLELGSKSEQYHFEVGEYLGQLPVDVIYLYGPLAKHIQNGVEHYLDEVELKKKASGEMDIEDSVPHPVIECFSDLDTLRSLLKDSAKTGDVILFKGSNSMGLTKIVADFRNEV